MLTTKNDYFPMRLASFGFPIEALYVLCNVRNESLYVMSINFTIQGAKLNFIFSLKQMVTRVVRMNRIMFWLTINFQDKKKEYHHGKIYTNMNTEWY